MIDVTEVILDPLISDTFDVRRQSESVALNGRTQIVPEWFREQRGVIKPADSAGLTRRDDGQYVSNEITVLTNFALRDASIGFQPDVVLWDGVEYTVSQALPYRRLAGFTKARCVSTRAIDAPQ